MTANSRTIMSNGMSPLPSHPLAPGTTSSQPSGWPSWRGAAPASAIAVPHTIHACGCRGEFSTRLYARMRRRSHLTGARPRPTAYGCVSNRSGI